VSGPPRVQALARADLPDLVALCAAALPDEALSLDDLEGVLFSTAGAGADAASTAPLVSCRDAATFVVRDEGALVGAVGVSLQEVLGIGSAHVQLLVVHPARRRRGIARALIASAEAWSLGHGVTTVTIGAGAPFYLFTGVDSRWTDALCCFEALGYERTGVELDLTCPTVPSRRAHRHVEPGDRIEVAHVQDADDAGRLGEWVVAHYPHWSAEFARAAEAGTVVVARQEDGGELLGAAAHSVSRFGVIGPVAVAPGRQRSGVGAQLMAEVLADLSTAGLRSAEIAWTSTVRFYANVGEAQVGRASVVLRRELGA
jgi:mycothiol synthase